VSEQNVEIVRRAYAHTQATGRVYAQVMAPDFVWDMSKFPGPSSSSTRALTARKRSWTTGRTSGRTGSSRLRRSTTPATRVVLHQRGRAKATGMPADMSFAKVWPVRAGKLTRMEMYADPAEALKAVNLEK
jgi:ketosteroid isomerase-like protein